TPGSAACLVLALALPGIARADQSEVVTYREVKAVFKAQCFKCHSPEEKRARLDLTTYGALMRGSTSGAVVIKGNPAESLLYLVVSHQEEPRMPPGSPKMPEDRLELIHRWIAAGAPERAEDASTTPPATVITAAAVTAAPPAAATTRKPVRPA